MTPPEHPPTPRHDTRVTPQLVLGLLAMASGVLMTLDNLNLLDAGRYLRFWPAALVTAGALSLRRARDRHHGGFGGVLFLSAGTWLLLEPLSLAPVGLRELWPALLAVAGGVLAWHGRSGPRRHTSTDANALVFATAVLGSVRRGNNSASFRGGELTAVMGGCELDLRQAALHGEAVVDIFALWGGVDIQVPDDWTVVCQVTPVLGGVDDQTRPPGTAVRRRLVLRGVAVMAGVQVKN